MTERKPYGMSWQSWADRQIGDAERRGEFRDLPGAGKPIPNAGEGYDPDWWLKDFLKREGLTVLPQALQLKLDVERELARIRGLSSERARRDELGKLNDQINRRNATITAGPPSTVTTIPVDATLDEWQRADRAQENAAPSSTTSSKSTSRATSPESSTFSSGGRRTSWLSRMLGLGGSRR